MKAKVLKSYPDKITKRFYNEGEIVDFDNNRIQELTEKKIVTVLRENKTKKELPETSD